MQHILYGAPSPCCSMQTPNCVSPLWRGRRRSTSTCVSWSGRRRWSSACRSSTPCPPSRAPPGEPSPLSHGRTTTEREREREGGGDREGGRDAGKRGRGVQLEGEIEIEELMWIQAHFCSPSIYAVCSNPPHTAFSQTPHYALCSCILHILSMHRSHIDVSVRSAAAGNTAAICTFYMHRSKCTEVVVTLL